MKKNDRGFSIAELCVLLGVSALIAAIAIPVLTSGMQSMQLISDARSIATTMSYAKMSAASQATRYRLSFNLDSNQWSLLKLDTSSGTFQLQQAVNALSRGVGHSGIRFKSTSSTAPQGFSTSSSPTLTFNSRGILVEPTSGVGIVYLSNRTDDYAVSASLSGKVQIWRLRDGAWIAQ